MGEFNIGMKKIGFNTPVYFIADLAANHDGSLDRAKELIHLAAESGADAAKFQNFTASKIVSRRGFETLGNQIAHQAKWKKSVYEVYEDASISQDWTKELKKTCDQVWIEYFTSPYDFESIDHVDQYVSVYKIGSGDITWPEILHYIGKKGKPVLIASGASEFNDVKRAIGILKEYTTDIVLMQCNTNYTASFENFKFINLNVLKSFSVAFPGVVLGLSDHTQGHSTVLGSVALGARVIEKHFTDDNNREGPDHRFSMTPATWREMVQRTRELELALGDGFKRIEENEVKSSIVQRRALHTTKNLAIGHILTRDDLEALRPIPEDGIPPYEIESLLGKRISHTINKGSHITWNHIESSND